ncbi:MAG: DUF541 domain-containing protein [Clostridiales bacterium]|nr:DUF541 domain-containing protein [Clostridiales bacterium]
MRYAGIACVYFALPSDCRRSMGCGCDRKEKEEQVRRNIMMKKRILIALSCLLVVLLAVPAVSEVAEMLLPAAEEATITVTGNAVILVPADTATVRLGVTESSQNVLEAQAAMNAKIETIRAALIESGIDAADINTDRLNIYTNYNYDAGVETVAGYTASSTLSVVTKDMEKAGSIIDVAFAAGANNLNGISFAVADTASIMDEAYLAAMDDARAKAELLAGAEGLTLSCVKAISQGNSYSYDSMSNAVTMEYAAAKGASTFVQAALIEVSASVNVSYGMK